MKKVVRRTELNVIHFDQVKPTETVVVTKKGKIVSTITRDESGDWGCIIPGEVVKWNQNLTDLADEQVLDGYEFHVE